MPKTKAKDKPGKASVKPEKTNKTETKKADKTPKATTDVLTRAERKALQEQIRSAREALAMDKATRPKRQLTPKQLENLAKGRALNSKFHPKESLSTRLEKQANFTNASNGHVAAGY